MLKFLYQTMPGRCILKLLTRPGLSRFVGRFMDSAISRPIIPFSVAGFVRNFGP